MGLDKEDIKQLIAILQKGLSDDDNLDVNTEEKPVQRKQQTNSRENKFLTLGLDNLHKEDIAIDKVLNQKPPTPRRKAINLIDVQCRVCGKKDKINPGILHDSPDRYKCNKCCSSPG